MRHTFKVRQTKNDPSIEFTVEMPSDIDGQNMPLIEKRFGSVERMIDRANSQWTVDVAVGVRKRLPNEESAAMYAAQYCDDGRKDTHVPTLDKEAAIAQGFTQEQLDFIASQGMKIA